MDFYLSSSKRTPAFLGAGLLALLVGGCTYSSLTPGVVDGSPAAGQVSTPAAMPMKTPEFILPEELPAPSDPGAGENKIVELTSQTQGASFGPLTLDSGTVVYIKCAGGGSLVLELTNVGRVTTPCENSGDPRGTRHVFDTRLVHQTPASVESSPGQIWSLGVYAAPVP